MNQDPQSCCASGKKCTSIAFILCNVIFLIYYYSNCKFVSFLLYFVSTLMAACLIHMRVRIFL